MKNAVFPPSDDPAASSGHFSELLPPTQGGPGGGWGGRRKEALVTGPGPLEGEQGLFVLEQRGLEQDGLRKGEASEGAESRRLPVVPGRRVITASQLLGQQRGDQGDPQTFPRESQDWAERKWGLWPSLLLGKARTVFALAPPSSHPCSEHKGILGNSPRSCRWDKGLQEPMLHVGLPGQGSDSVNLRAPWLLLKLL